MGSGTARRHPRLHERESTPETLGEQAVGLGAVTDHQQRLRPALDQVHHEIGHRSIGLAGEGRLDSADRGDRCDERSTTRLETLRGRIGRIAIGSDQSGTVEHGATGDAEPLVVEVTMESDHHRIDRSIEVGSVVRDGNRSPILDCLANTGPAGDEDSFARFDEERRCHRRRHDVAGGIDTDLGERGLVLCHERRTVVRDEQHPTS